MVGLCANLTASCVLSDGVNLSAYFLAIGLFIIFRYAMEPYNVHTNCQLEYVVVETTHLLTVRCSCRTPDSKVIQSVEDEGMWNTLLQALPLLFPCICFPSVTILAIPKREG